MSKLGNRVRQELGKIMIKVGKGDGQNWRISLSPIIIDRILSTPGLVVTDAELITRKRAEAAVPMVDCSGAVTDPDIHEDFIRYLLLGAEMQRDYMVEEVTVGYKGQT